MDRRGIISTDLIFASIIILVIVSSIISVASERIDAASTTDELGNARMTAEYVAGAINKVYNGGYGHAVTLSLPANISGEGYDIRVNSSGVFVLIDGKTGKSSISHNKINGTFSMYGNRDYIIRNVKGPDGNSWIVISTI
jgi:hypothetical protein